jgi:hypothetical protein
MAVEPKATAESPLQEEAVSRLVAARAWKSQWEMDFRECYFFASPHRQRFLNSTSQPALRIQDAPQLNTDEAFILCGDFVTEIVNAFMPEAKPWCELGPGEGLPAEVWKKVEADVRKSEQAIFNAMKTSNLYPEVAKAFYPDLSIGTVGLWIDRPHPAHPIDTMAIPLRELDVNLGPRGEIDDRFVTRHTRNVHVRELVGETVWEKIGGDLKKEITEKPKSYTQVVWGFWRRWAGQERRMLAARRDGRQGRNEPGARGRDQGRGLLSALGRPLQPDAGFAVRPRPADPGPAVAAPDRRDGNGARRAF